LLLFLFCPSWSKAESSEDERKKTSEEEKKRRVEGFNQEPKEKKTKEMEQSKREKKITESGACRFEIDRRPLLSRGFLVVF